MDELLKRYDSFSAYTQNLCFKKAKDALGENPTEKQVKDFAAKFERAEEVEAKVKVKMPELIKKRNTWNTIKNHKLYDPEKMSARFKLSMKSCTEKLKEFVWDEEEPDKLLKGRPIATVVDKINTTNLEKLWNEFLGANTKIVDAAGFEDYITKANVGIKANRATFQMTKGATDKMEQWNTYEARCREILEETGQVDVAPMEEIRTYLGSLVRNWEKIYSDIKIRTQEYKKHADPKDFKYYTEILFVEFQEAYENKSDDLETIYNKIDKLLPAMGTFEKSFSTMRHVTEKQIEKAFKNKAVPKVVDDDEDIVYASDFDEEEEEEEEDDEDDSSSSEEVLPTRKRRGAKRDRDSLGQVLTIFSGTNSHLKELDRVYKEDGDSSEFDKTLKKIKDTFVDRHQVIVYNKTDDKALPFIPDPTIFYSEEDAMKRGEELVKMTPEGGYDFKVVLVPKNE